MGIIRILRNHASLIAVWTVLCCNTAVLSAQLGAHHEPGNSPTPGEVKTEKAFETARSMGAPELYAFLRPMPKGADLHMHLSGAVYAESFIAEAVKQGLCIAPVDAGAPAVPVAQAAVRFVPPAGKNGACDAGQVPAADAMKNQKLYDDLVDSFSMRAYMPTPGISGHDQFFATFDRFGGLKDFSGEWLDEVARRAAAQNEQYLEIMQTPSFEHTAAAGYQTGWPGDINDSNHMSKLADLRQKLLSSALREDIAEDEKEFAAAKAKRDELESCRTGSSSVLYATASSADQGKGCSVNIHFLYQVLRGFPPQQVFAQALLGFEVASADPDVVGINFVMPEDGRISMQDYHLQMLMLDYLHSVYPNVRISLHAGELAPGMVPPAGLNFHVREAIDLGHAERIGHGVDVLYEDHPAALLKEMADKHVMVEVNLTSNDVILGIKGKDHPLAAYLAAHVPVALSTDDEGVSRIDLTHEYVRGATEQGLNYIDLKNMARTSLEHAFLHGNSLWAKQDDYTQRVPECTAAITANAVPNAKCQAFLSGSEKAAAEWELERRFANFEQTAH